ncbi:PbrT family lead (Pb2+) uptake porter [Acidipropionibacterium acidipropionici ATCC 4875]|uniref:PbrT family lead (Pb2+) uptake porter n=1 Tax=Acidipropionibacterium acidipropionici (strain ATCC 4875 / DSM 20272 / JCM 6432 / NBRC 12425 / NCIMB 8070 / 4) TaxID=1171373 RepID=K7S8V8_ACIA4|nr:iron uptake system protein EfeO [Acidipropionibacterium acidipropionici]AFV90997.1 PbrT family lead (Pb2+) uptake porter [Acidipropionibacterium acidipropionici ATCC 4875]
MPSSNLRRSAAGALALAALLTAAGCTDNTDDASAPAGSASAGRPTFTITGSGDTCSLSATTLPGGQVTVTIANNGSTANEFEILTENKLQIIAEKENIGPGVTTTLTTALEKGTYYTACKPNMVGALKGVQKLTVTAGSGKEVSADTQQLEQRAITNYTAYVKDQVGQLLTRTTAFTKAYTSGDTAKAKELYPVARSHYERIEPTAEAFGIKEAGDLDAALDLRVQDIAADAGKKVTDPSVLKSWTGWHRIEADLFTADGSAFKFASAADRKAAADQLNKDTQNLYNLVYGKINGASGKFALKLTDVVTGASSLLEEIATSKIVGEEETFSHTDLPDFKANLEGAQVAYGNVQALVKKSDADLDAEVTQSFKDLETLLKKYEDGKDSMGNVKYVDYSTIAAVQKDAGEAPKDSAYTKAQRELSDEVNVSSEALSKVPGKILH